MSLEKKLADSSVSEVTVTQRMPVSQLMSTVARLPAATVAVGVGHLGNEPEDATVRVYCPGGRSSRPSAMSRPRRSRSSSDGLKFT